MRGWMFRFSNLNSVHQSLLLGAVIHHQNNAKSSHSMVCEARQSVLKYKPVSKESVKMLLRLRSQICHIPN